ncbi:threonylcarbamoyladenosine tRNA methylthiotransferase isoform X1, partial [Lates japonicus]
MGMREEGAEEQGQEKYGRKEKKKGREMIGLFPWARLTDRRICLLAVSYGSSLEQQKKVVVAEFVFPRAQPRMDYLKGLSIIGVQQIDRVVEVVDEAVK